jgi:hypothetical protein
MHPSNLPQKPLAWYTADPLRGSGNNGAFLDDDILSALCISRAEFQAIKGTCIKILDKQVEDSQLKIDLRTLWKRRDRTETKEMMLINLIRAHPKTFDDTRRLQHIPTNWSIVKRALAELCFVSANASRSRKLKRNTESRVKSSNIHTCDTTPSTSTDIWMTHELPQTPPYGLHFLLTHHIILNNVIVPAVYQDRRVDILPYRFQRSNAKLGEPQYIRDVALDRLLSILKQEFEIDSILQVWGMDSRCSLVELKNDDCLTVALISFLQSAWSRGCQHPPGLEVRCPVQSLSPSMSHRSFSVPLGQ